MKKLLLLLLLSIVNFSVAQVALSEDFESTTFPPTGWSTINTHATNNWVRTTTPITGTGSAMVQWIAEDQDESLISPLFDLTTYSTAFLNFTARLGYQYMAGANPNGNLEVTISTDGGANWDNLWVEEDYGVYAEYADLYIHIDLSSYVGQSGLQVKFEYIGNDADTAKIDNISVTSCKPVDAVGLTALTDNTATTGWTADAASYDFEWGALNFTQGTGTLSNQTGTTFNFTGLTAGTGYTYYVRANCGSGSTAPWQGPFNFYTTLSTPTALPYSYGFETPTLPMAGWARTFPTTGGTWATYNAPTFAQEGTSVAGCFGSTTAATNAWLFSRGLTLTAGEILTVTYYYRKYAAAGTGGTNKLKSAIGTDKATAATTFVTLQDNGTVAPTAMTLQTKTYTVPTTNTYYIGFNCYSPQQTTAINGAILLDAVAITSNLSNNQFDLYDNMAIISPNPVQNSFQVKLDDSKLDVSKISLTVTDINGKVVKQYTKADSYDASSLQSGVYFLTVSDGVVKDVKKLIKK